MARRYPAFLGLIAALTLLITSCWSIPETPSAPSPVLPTETVAGTPAPAAQATVKPAVTPTAAPPSPVALPASKACPTPVAGSFAAVYDSAPEVRQRLGCPTSAASNTQAAGQDFQNGTMYWRGDLTRIYVLYGSGEWAMYPDTFKEGDRESAGETPPSGLYEPVRGFGKVWREQPPVRPKLGWAIEKERGFQGTIQPFAHGVMLSNDRQVIYILSDDGTWQKGASGTQ